MKMVSLFGVVGALLLASSVSIAEINNLLKTDGYVDYTKMGPYLTANPDNPSEAVSFIVCDGWQEPGVTMGCRVQATPPRNCEPKSKKPFAINTNKEQLSDTYPLNQLVGRYAVASNKVVGFIHCKVDAVETVKLKGGKKIREVSERKPYCKMEMKPPESILKCTLEKPVNITPGTPGFTNPKDLQNMRDGLY